MARRRRKRNPLLGRILVVSIAAHAIGLPILAHFGAFDKIKREFGASRVVMVTVPPLEDKKPPEKAKKEKKATDHPAKKSAAASSKSTRASHSNVNAPKVVASAGAGGDDGSGPTVDASANGKAGVLPTAPKGPPAGTGEVKPPDNPAPTPPAKATEPVVEKPVPPPPAPPKAKKFVQVEATYEPEPTIPDELRAEPFEKTLVVEANVDTDGAPKDVKIATSTGVSQLDEIGLDTARKYRFRPATLDDVPVQGHVRFRIIFKVEG